MRATESPRTSDLAALTEHRDDASVSIYLSSSKVPLDTGPARIALKNAISDAATQLAASKVGESHITQTLAPLRALDRDDDFWRHQAPGIALLASGGSLHAFALTDTVHEFTSVGNRFDLGPLLRSASDSTGAFLLTLTEGHICLYRVTKSARPVVLDLELPDDLDSILAVTDNEGQRDRQRPAGANGDRTELERYARTVQDAVLAVIRESTDPLVLAAGSDLDRAYRAINTYAGLLAAGISANPTSLAIDDLNARTRAILDERNRLEIAEWKEQFGNRRSNGLATSRLKEVAQAATAAAVDELYFDVDSVVEGTIDDLGMLAKVDEPGADTYNLVDEIAVRVLRGGGRIRGVHNSDLLDGSPVAATLRFPV